jgi:class 3 adenylate cyclase
MMGFNESFTASLKAKTHLLSQLRKIVYPHQLKMMSEGTELEATMPTVSAEACVISFDIVGSSKIQHEKAKEFFRSVFLRCNEMMMGGYDGESLKADAYRIKEMGDGFLCSVGYPFRSKTGYMAKDAIELSIKFHEVFREEVERLGYREPIHCGIGIALDHITGFYPESGTKEYDLYGKAIILATRYEGMRKILFREGTGGSYLIVQERVYMSLREEEARNFTTVNLEEAGIVVRDDPSAKRLHYMELSTASERADFMRKKIS